ITQSGVEGIATRHGYRIEQLELSLFNLDTDAEERHNVTATHPEVVKRLSTLAADARRELGDSLQGVKGSGLRAHGIDTSKEANP
ncbi:MAG: atsA 21, partial [Planctomycetaceae bacterium]|nr:atsA 21 [Planctomycetaceae bacterium]